jgi:hypothetical protein
MVSWNAIKAVDLYESKKKDPVKILWRSVLAKAIEDAIKTAFRIIQNKEFYENKKFAEIMYVTEPSQDFATVCHYAGLDHKIVRTKVTKVLKEIEESDGKKDLPDMPWKRLYMDGSKDKRKLPKDEIHELSNRVDSGHDSTMQSL